MFPDDVKDITLDEYRQLEGQLHLQLMNTCKKYMSQLGIVSIRGILDIVKQEVVELEIATRKSFKKEENETETDAEEKLSF